MASTFDQIADSAHAALRAIYQEAICYQPMRSVINGRPEADSERPVVAAHAIPLLQIVEAEIDAKGISSEKQLAKRFSVGRFEILRDVLPYIPKQGDQIERVDQPGRPTYRVHAVDADGPSRWHLAVALIGGVE